MEINAHSISDAWPQILKSVLIQGQTLNVVVDETPRRTLEYSGIIVTNIDTPCNDMIPRGSKFDKSALNKYADQFCCGDDKGFAYSYGNRLRNYHGVDQIYDIINKLEKDPESRRAVAITWQPSIDLNVNHVPCMLLCDFKIRNDRLNLTAYFRSHDIYGAFPSNAYGLAKLMEKVLDLDKNVPEQSVAACVGRLTIISNAAHIYEHDILSSRQIAGIIA